MRGHAGPSVGAVSAHDPSRSRRRVRGIGRGRRTRRALARGGTGPARRLNETLSGWSGVRITPMFGRWGYFAGARLFACFPLSDKDRDLWIRLSLEDQRRALVDARVRPHRRFGGRGWIEMVLEDPRDLDRALYWLRRAHAAAGRSGEDD
jgi:luciferase-like monooxygenase